MPGRHSHVPIAMVVLWAWSGRAEAQIAPTCAFDPAAAAVTVKVDGVAAHLAVDPITDAIELNGVPCSGATTLNTDSIQVNGGSRPDTLSVTSPATFAPGLT